MDSSFVNDIYLTYQYLPFPFKEYNENQGKRLYDEVMNWVKVPDSTNLQKLDPRDYKGAILFHLSENTRDLVSWLENNKAFILGSGHMSLEDQHLILEILFHHGFCMNKIYHSTLFQLYSLMVDYLTRNYENLTIKLDWRPVYNTIYALTTKRKIHTVLMTYTDDNGNIYNKLETLCFRIKKFFDKDASHQICELLEESLKQSNYSGEKDPEEVVEQGGYSIKFTHILWFVLLIPVNRENTSIEEIKRWLPSIFEIWEESPYSDLKRQLFFKLLSEIVSNYPEIDLSEYNEWLEFQLFRILKSSGVHSIKPFSKSYWQLNFTGFLVWSYKPIKFTSKIDKNPNLDFSKILERYKENLHPESWMSKEDLIKFIKIISSVLCSRLKYEKKMKDSNPDHSCEYCLEQEDITYFIEMVKPYLDLAIQGQTALMYVSRCLKNLIILDCDSILSMYMFQNFHNLSDLVNVKFLVLLHDIVVGVILSDQTNSNYKYNFIQNVIKYLLEQTKLLDAVVLKGVVAIFNIIWTNFPVLPVSWGKNLIESEHPGIDYHKYMKNIKVKSPQEYQFYKLYEKIHDYAIEYFDILKSAMNLDLSISSELIKGFKFLLNAMPVEVFKPLVLKLLESSNMQYSKSILGRIVNNIASRSPETAKEMLAFCLDHRLLEKDEETGKDVLFSYNYDTNDYYISIVSSAAYQNKEGAKAYIKKIITLFKLITENFEEDKHKNNFNELFRALISPFTKLNIKFPWIINLEKWSNRSYQSNLWKNIGKCYFDKVNVELEHITQEDIDIVIEIVNDHIFPWLQHLVETCKDKNQVKIASIIVTDVYSHVCTLFPSKTESNYKDFTLFYYEKLEITKESISKLRQIEVDIFDLCEKLHLKVIDDDSQKRNVEIISNIGSVYRQIIQANVLSVKSFIFNENVSIYSPLEDRNCKRQLATYISTLNVLTGKLVSSISGEYVADNQVYIKSLERTFEYENYFWQLPTVQRKGKLGYTPKFVRFYFENFEFFDKQMEDLFENIMGAVKVVLPQKEILAKDEDYLVGILILFDSLLNLRFEFNSERTHKMIQLLFESSGVKKQKLRDLIWDFWVRNISSPVKYDEYERKIEVDQKIQNFSESSLELLDTFKQDYSEELAIRCKLNVERQKLRDDVVLNLLDQITEHQIDFIHDEYILSLVERWLRFYKPFEQALIKMTNFLSSRLLIIQASYRNKAMTLFFKTLQMRVKCNELANVSFFKSSSQEMQDMDQLYASLLDQGENFVINLIETIMHDWGVKEDNKLISDDNGRKVMKTTYKKGRKKRTVTKVISNKITRYFKMFNNFFTFYGAEVFKKYFYPVIKNYIDNNFEGKDHTNVWKLTLFDMLCAFIKTSKHYYDQCSELYDECTDILYLLYDSKSKQEVKVLYKDSIVDWLFHRDIKMMDNFLNNLIVDIPNGVPTKVEKSLELLTHFLAVYGWKMLPYLRKWTLNILKWDPCEIKIQVTYIDEVPDILRFLLHKNKTEMMVVFAAYIFLSYKLHPDEEHEEAKLILEYIQKSIKVMKTCSKIVLENVSLSFSILFNHLFQVRQITKMPDEFIEWFIELWLLTEEESLKEKISSSYSNLLPNLMIKIESVPFRNKIQAFIEPFLTHEAWRVRETSIFLYHCCNLYLFENIGNQQNTIDLAINNLRDEHVQVVNWARNLLSSWLERDESLVPELVESNRSKALKLLKSIKAYKHSTDEYKTIAIEIKFHCNILLAIITNYVLSLEPWVPELALFIHKLIPFAPTLKLSIFDFLNDYKMAHQQLIMFQESKYPQELLENMKELFTLNSHHYTAY